MAARRPGFVVTVNGVVTPFLEASTSHSVEAPIAQASVAFAAPPPAGVVEDAPVRIEARGDAGETLETLFVGKLRGPLERGLSEGDATVTARLDGNLWRMTFPALADLSWVGPITPRKLLRQLFAFSGITEYRVEQFVHPTTGVPLLLGGVPWFDDGRVILPAGTTPLAFADRVCRLFGYRVFDRPDGSVRVARVSGPPPAADHEFAEGVDILGVSRATDLHEIATYWEAQGASGSDAAGQQVAVVSRPRKGVRSRFVPNPPKYAGASVSDPLLVTQPLADAARIVKEFDAGGVAWRVSGEVIGASRALAGLAPRQAFAVTSARLGLSGKVFWQTGVAHEIGPRGYWTTVEGWRPTGKPARTAPPEEPAEPPPPGRDDPVTPPSDAELDPVQDPLPATWEAGAGGQPWGNPDGDPAPPESLDDNPNYDPIQDIDYEPTALDGIGLPSEGTIFVCVPAPSAPARSCESVGLLEPAWATAAPVSPGLALPFAPPLGSDTVTVTGEAQGGPGTVEVWQGGLLIGSAPLPAAPVGAWTAFSVRTPAALLAPNEAEVRIVGAV